MLKSIVFRWKTSPRIHVLTENPKGVPLEVRARLFLLLTGISPSQQSLDIKSIVEEYRLIADPVTNRYNIETSNRFIDSLNERLRRAGYVGHVPYYI